MEAYKKNFEAGRPDDSFDDAFPKKRLYREYIVSAFSWIGTPEGLWYWRVLQDEWNLIFDKYKHRKYFNS